MMFLDEAHKAFLASAPNYEAQFDDYKKEVSQVGLLETFFSLALF